MVLALSKWMRLGIPDEKQAALFGQSILDRYGVGQEDKALGYLDRLIDRIINKARGILTFNSLGITISSLFLRENNLVALVRYPLILSIFLLVVSSIILLAQMFTGFVGNIDDYSGQRKECEFTAKLIMTRAFYLNWCTLLSGIGFPIAAIVVCIYAAFYR